MASEAEVELIISTANTLPQLERDLDRIVASAEASADDVELQAVLDRQDSIARLIDDVTEAISNVNSVVPEIEIEAALETVETLQNLHDDLDDVIEIVQANAVAIQLDAELDADVAELDAEIATLVAGLEESAPEIDLQVDVDRDGSGARQALNLGKAFRKAIDPIASVAKNIGLAGAAAGSAVPLLAGVAAATQQIAPAAALAAPAILSVALATNTVKLAMVGVGDAIKQAFDPETSPEELAESLKNLAPSARAFVLELQGMRKGLKAIQQGIQQTFFTNLDKDLKILGESVLPVFARAAQNTAFTLNEMARGAAAAAVKLGKDGTFGNALSSANIGLFNLTKVPGQVVTAFGQLAAAAGPAFERVTRAAGDAATRVSEKLAAAFESGALESAIDKAVTALKELGSSIGNIFKGLGNVFNSLTVDGQGLFSTLEQVTKAFADVTGTKGFQDALRALSQTVSSIVTTALPLLSQALQILGPVFQNLGPPLQLLVKALGEGLGKVLTALGPVLESASRAFGRLVGLITPFIDLAAELIAAILPSLTPLFDSLGVAFNAMIPFVKQLVESLKGALLPVFESLATKVLPQILPPLTELAIKIFPIMTDILIALTPSLAKLGEAFAQVLVEIAPLIVQMAALTVEMLDKLMPIIQPLIDLILRLVNTGLAILVFQISTIVVPAIRILVNLLQGDFSGAWQGAKDIVTNVAAKIGEVIGAMKERVLDHLRGLAVSAQEKVREIRDKLSQGFSEMRDRAREIVGQIPGILQSALAGAANILFGAGADIIRGLINGIRGQIPSLREIAREAAGAVTDSVKGLLGIHSPSRVMMEVGADTMEGFRIGIADAIPDLRQELQGVAALAPSFAMPDGSTLQLPQFSAGAPVVQVYLGNELINQHVDTRIVQANESRDRLITRGGRR